MNKPLEKFLNTLPKKVIFCKLCTMSNQRPRIIFDKNGVCSGCKYLEVKKNKIDWKKREKELKEICDHYRLSNGHWDVLVPGSGGKDSGYVAHLLKNKYNMNPLCVTWAPNKYTDIGFKNFESFVDSGFTTINCFPNGKLNRLLSRISFEELGDNFVPFVMGQHSYVYHIAKRFNINLVFFGEIADLEYGGDPKIVKNGSLPIEESAMNYWKGNTIDSLIEYALKNKNYFSKNDFTPQDLIFYRPPRDLDPKTKVFFMSYFTNWKPQENFYYAFEHTGYKPNSVRNEGTYSKYESLDDRLDGLHYYMMYIKFGFGRATVDTAHEIRDGHITLQEGINLVKQYDHEFPKKYFKDTLEFLNLDEKKFWKVVDSFRLDHIWKKVNGEWRLRHTVSKDGVDDK